MPGYQYIQSFFAGIFLLIMTTGLSLAEADSTIPFPAKVHLSVTAPDSIKGQVESRIIRQLGSLQDFALVDEGAEWELNILALEFSISEGNPHGIVLSVVVLMPANEMLTGKPQDDFGGGGDQITSGLYRTPHHWVQAGFIDQLPALCAQLVANFELAVSKGAGVVRFRI